MEVDILGLDERQLALRVDTAGGLQAALFVNYLVQVHLGFKFFLGRHGLTIDGEKFDILAIKR